MKKAVPIVIMIAVAAASCQSADPNVVAKEMCACIDPIKAKMSAKTEAIYIKATKNTATAQQVMQDELMAITDTTERQRIATEMMESGTLMQGTKFQTCVTEIDKKHKVRKSEEKQKQQEIIAALEKQCPLAAGLMKAGLQQMGK